MGVGGQRHAPAALPPGNSRYPLYRRLSGPQGRSGRGQQDATLHSLFYLETALHVSGGTSTHQQERIQLYLQHLVFVTPLLLPAATELV
jgi:hypothetical protein